MGSAGQPGRRRPRKPVPAEHAGAELQPRHGAEAQVPSALRMTETLMRTAARTEREIAETLREMATQAQGEIAARRLKLAEEAVRGAQAAERHTAHLQQLSQQWTEHADVVKLHRLLTHASQVLTDLAQTQQEIADTFDSLASRDGSALAARRRQLAAAAAASARDAREQAQDLHKLAGTSAAMTRRPSPPERG